MKKPAFKIFLVVSGTLAISLIGSGCDMTARIGHVLENVQAIAAIPEVTPMSAEHREAAELFINLNDKHNFFAARYKGCHTQKNQIICDTFYKDTAKKNSSASEQLKPAQIAKFLKQNQLSKVSTITESSAIRGIGALNTSDRNKLVKSLLKSNTCASVHLYAAAGFKIEEQLPDTKALDTVLSLYRKAMECGKAEEISELALYRLGLLEIAQDNFEAAITPLEKLSEASKDIALSSRAHFWTNFSKRQIGQKVSDKELENYFTNYPLSYHTLSDYAALEDGPFQTVNDNNERGEIRRSIIEKLNNSIQMIEYFLEHKKDELARRGLEFIDYSLLTEAEPGFQLYVAMLLSRFDDMNHQRFTVLSRLFQRYPDFKTIKNLGIYYPLAYENLVLKHQRDQDPYLLLSLMRQESSFNPSTKSPVGAVGLMQIMPRTAQDMRRNVNEKDLLDPAKNIEIGAHYFSRLVKQFDADHMKALASYNAGSGNVRKWERRYPVSNPLLFVDLIPFDETREYVSGILRNQYWYSRLYPQLKIAGPVAAANIDKK